MSQLSLVGLEFRYSPRGRPVIDNLSLDVPQGDFLAVLGASGAGKTTLLRLMAGLLHPSAGAVRRGQTDVFRIRPRDRQIGYCPQDSELYAPSATVEQTVLLPMRSRRWSRNKSSARCGELLKRSGLWDLRRQKARYLSGGEAQRLSFVRALGWCPEILLLDEPFSDVDTMLRPALFELLIEEMAGTKSTTIIVTHSPDEALRYANRIAVVDRGRVVQVGSPAELANHPNHLVVLRLLHHDEHFDSEADLHQDGRSLVWAGGQTGLRGVFEKVPGNEVPEGPIRLVALPHEVELRWSEGTGPTNSHLSAALTGSRPIDGRYLLSFQTPIGSVSAWHSESPPLGTVAELAFRGGRLRAFGEDDGFAGFVHLAKA